MFSTLFRDVKKTWILFFLIVSIAMMLYPPYHTVIPGKGEEFVGYSTLGTMPEVYSYKAEKFTSIDYRTLAYHEAILAVICCTCYTFVTMIKRRNITETKIINHTEITGISGKSTTNSVDRQFVQHIYETNLIPNILIYRNTLRGELDVSNIIFRTHVIPQKNVSVHKEPYENSPTTYVSMAGDHLNVIATEVHCYPRNGVTRIIDEPFEDFIHHKGKYSYINKNKILPNIGDYIYLLRYSGEGVYRALYKDNEILVPYNGIKNISDKVDKDGIHRGFYAIFEGEDERQICEEWLCVKNKTGMEGWVQVDNIDNWKSSNSWQEGQGIFHYNKQ